MYQDNFERIFPIIMSGKIRCELADFIVDEIPSVTPIGSGEHIWLKIKKTGENTDWIASQLAQIAQVKRRDVSYAGIKDRHAVTTQWFSIYLPKGDTPKWQSHLPDSVEILEETRHSRKLRIGTLKGNQFTLIIRDCLLADGISKIDIDERIEKLSQVGIPNYFGVQRFGRDFSNLDKAHAWFQGDFEPRKRKLQGLLLSSARSWIFNQILSERIRQGNWNKAVDGDVFMLDHSKSWFVDEINDEIHQRLNQHDIHTTGALWGAGKLPSNSSIAQLEEEIAIKNSALSEGLVYYKLKQERRALRLPLKKLHYEWLNNKNLCLKFILPSGKYATSVLRELLEI